MSVCWFAAAPICCGCGQPIFAFDREVEVKGQPRHLSCRRFETYPWGWKFERNDRGHVCRILIGPRI